MAAIAYFKRVVRDSLALAVGACLPVVVVACGYHEWLAHRSDYVGHFLAGAGGTLLVVALVLWSIPAEHFSRLAPPAVVLLALAAIGAGGFLEATVYRLAKFDEVDFANQSLGAVIATLGMLVLVRSAERRALRAASAAGADVSASLALSDRIAKPSAVAFALAAMFGVHFLRAGYHYAFL